MRNSFMRLVCPTRWTLLAACTALTFAIQPVPAQTGLSSGVIRINVLTASGGATDVVARIIAARLSTLLAMPVIVEDEPGGFMGPGIRATQKAAPDGHTILLITSSILTQQLTHPSIKSDLISDFAPITEVAAGPLILVARKDLPVKTVADLVQYAKTTKTTVAVGGASSVFDFATTLLEQQTGIEVIKVPYASGGPALNDVLGGHVDAMFDVAPAEVGQVQQGNVIGLMVTDKTRLPVLPDVPTAAEAGLKNFEVSNWFGLIGPKDMPPAVVQNLRDDVVKIMAMPDVLKQLSAQGVSPVGSQPAEWGAYLVADKARWAKVLAIAGSGAK